MRRIARSGSFFLTTWLYSAGFSLFNSCDFLLIFGIFGRIECVSPIIGFSDHLHLIESRFSCGFHMPPMFLPSIRPEKIHDFVLVFWPMDLYEDCRMTSTDRFQSALYRVIFCALNIELDHRWIDIQRINRDCANQRGISSPSIIRRIRYWLMIEAVTHRAIW